MNIYTIVMLTTLILGLMFLLTSYIKVNKKPINNYTKKVTLNELVDKISNNRITQALVNPNTKDNKIKLEKLKTMKSRLTLEKLLVYKIILAVLIVCSTFIVKFSFTKVAINEMLNPVTIYESTNYRVDSLVAQSIIEDMGERYKAYLKGNDYTGLANEIKEININRRLGLDDKDVLLMTDVYQSTYNSTKLTAVEVVLFLLLAMLSVVLINFYINIRYRIIRAKMLKEFEKLEIITILLLNRDDLNILEILKEMNRHSKYLRSYLTKCLRVYTSHPKKALATLIEDVDDPEFKSFIIVLSSCLDKSKEANQEVLKIQRKLRIMLEETTLNKKSRQKEFYLTMAQLPLLLAVSINLIYPVISGIKFDF